MRVKKCAACRVEKPIDQFLFNPVTGRYAHRCMSHERSTLPSLVSPKAYIRNKLATAKRNSTGNRQVLIDTEYVLGVYEAQEGRCAVTGATMTHQADRPQTNISIDRIDSTKGYIEGNIRLVCATVNFMKNRMTDKELVWWCKEIVRGKKQKARAEVGS